MSLNKRLMNLYNLETACQATYQKDGSTYHTLKYVDWLEERTTKLEELAQRHLTQQGNEPQAEICPLWKEGEFCAFSYIIAECRSRPCTVKRGKLLPC